MQWCYGLVGVRPGKAVAVRGGFCGPGRGLAAWEKPGRMTEQNAFTGQGAGLGVLPTSQSPFLISIMFFIICKARLELLISSKFGNKVLVEDEQYIKTTFIHEI